MRIEVQMSPFGTFTFPSATAGVVGDVGTLIVEVPNRPAWRVPFYRGRWQYAIADDGTGHPTHIYPPVKTS